MALVVDLVGAKLDYPSPSPHSTHVERSAILGRFAMVQASRLSLPCLSATGTPADMVNVRMQNDIKLAPEKRRK